MPRYREDPFLAEANNMMAQADAQLHSSSMAEREDVSQDMKEIQDDIIATGLWT